MDQFHGGLSRILSPLAIHPTLYGELIMHKYMKAKNKHKIFISEFSSFQIQYFSKILMLDKEELILDKE